MTTTFLITLMMMAFLMLAMSVGVIFMKRELKGSCGGVGNCACEEAELPKACDLVPGPGEARCLPEDVSACPGPVECPHH